MMRYPTEDKSGIIIRSESVARVQYDGQAVIKTYAAEVLVK